MKFALIFSIFLPTAFSQGPTDDWGCNHFGVIPMDYCYTSSSTVSYKFTCDGTDTAIYESYSGVECGDDPAATIEYSLSDVDTAECDNSESCGYFDITCDNVTTALIAVGVCYEYSSNSVYYTCLDSLLSYRFYDSTDCTGSYDIYAFDYDTNPYDDCEVK